MATETKQILEEIKSIKLELNFIKENMPERSMFLNTKEIKLLEESYKNEKNGKLVSSKDLKKQLGI